MTFDEEELQRAAIALHGSPVTQELMRRLEDRFTQEWKNSPPNDSALREHTWRMLKTVGALRDELTLLAKEPTVAAFNARLSGKRKGSNL